MSAAAEAAVGASAIFVIGLLARGRFAGGLLVLVGRDVADQGLDSAEEQEEQREEPNCRTREHFVSMMPWENVGMDNSKNVAWFVAGISVGAAVALLFAPQSGEDTRRLIGEQARKGRRRVEEMGRDAWDRGRDLFDKGRDLADDAAEMVGERVDQARREFQG